MKRVILILSLVCLCIGLAGCNNTPISEEELNDALSDDIQELFKKYDLDVKSEVTLIEKEYSVNITSEKFGELTEDLKLTLLKKLEEIANESKISSNLNIKDIGIKGWDVFIRIYSNEDKYYLASYDIIIKNDDYSDYFERAKESMWDYSSLKSELNTLKLKSESLSLDFELEVINWIRDNTTLAQLKKDIDEIISNYSTYREQIEKLNIINEEWESYRESLMDLTASKLEIITKYKKSILENSSYVKKISYIESIRNQYVYKINETFDDFIDEVEPCIE